MDNAGKVYFSPSPTELTLNREVNHSATQHTIRLKPVLLRVTNVLSVALD